MRKKLSDVHVEHKHSVFKPKLVAPVCIPNVEGVLRLAEMLSAAAMVTFAFENQKKKDTQNFRMKKICRMTYSINQPTLATHPLTMETCGRPPKEPTTPRQRPSTASTWVASGSGTAPPGT